MSALSKLKEAMARPARGTIGRGLYEIDAAGGPAGKTEVDFVNAIGFKPVAISEMAFGQRLLQWRSGRQNLQTIAVLFDAQGPWRPRGRRAIWITRAPALRHLAERLAAPM